MNSKFEIADNQFEGQIINLKERITNLKAQPSHGMI